MPQDTIERRLRKCEWQYAPYELPALATIEERLADAARRNRPIAYSELVRGVQFRLPNVAGGQPYEIVTHDWSGLDRSIVGDFLGYASMRSYFAHGFMVSAFAVDRVEMRPSENFFELMTRLRALRKDTEAERLRFWTDQMAKAHAHFSSQPTKPPLPSAAEFFEFGRTVLEGAATTLQVEARKRCDWLHNRAKEHCRSSDGLLRCEACEWAKPSEDIRGDIVEMHHRDPLATAPASGRLLTEEEAIASLAPLCPNCHRIAHSKKVGVFSVAELKKLVGVSRFHSSTVSAKPS